jgi:signal peptidase II
MHPMKPYLSSLLAGIVAFGIDRIHKFVQVSADCMGAAIDVCVGRYGMLPSPPAFGWQGGEIVPVTPFFNYVLVWNTGVSYGLLGDLPVWALGLVAVVAIVALGIWWWRTSDTLVRYGLMLVIGGALSNALDRLLYGAVADFFHFHWQDWSFYIFNLADVAITLGVLLLILDVVGIGRKRTA